MPALGRYELVRPLARGGMAEVYLARRRVAGIEKRLVIKRLRRDKNRDPRFLDMFVKEAQLSMSLVQQNIVPVFDFGRIGDDVFLAMEYIDGRDLGSSLARERGAGMPALLAAFIAAECCQALDHAHHRKVPVIHRDVTARNVLLSWAGEVKLADFGIAAVVGGAVTGTTFGTPGYMSPEQANGDEVDERTDVYALGLVLWESLTGEHVRPVDDRARTVEVARSGELPPMPEVVPPPLAAILARATQRERTARYASAREMHDELDAFMVRERTREGGAAPAKRIAEWLAARWGDARDDAPAGVELDAAGGMVTFLDDGAANVRGAQTQRSLAETAADEAPPEMIVLDSVPVAVLPEPEPRSEPPPSVPRRRNVLVLVLVLALVLVLVLAGLMAAGVLRRGAATPDAAVAIDARAIDAVATDAALPPPVDAEIADAVIEVAPPSDARPRPPPRHDAAALARPDAAPAALRSITIGASPWAYFVVDDDPKQYETPALLMLPIGPHRVTFTNPQLGVTRTVTVTVPPEGNARYVEKMN